MNTISVQQKIYSLLSKKIGQ